MVALETAGTNEPMRASRSQARRAPALLAALTALALAAAAVGASGAQLLLGGGAKAPAWSHWWCSASALHAGSSGGAHGGGLLAFAAGLLPHWPHLLALVIAPVTLVYLRRANARYTAGALHEGPDILSGPR
jgi:hypothetical protein